jgi:two-component system, response regulator
LTRILWAEDGLDDQYLIKHALGQLADKAAVQFVEDGVQALEHMAASLPDLVVLDVNMPVLNGLETLRRMRQDDRTKRLPVVVFSTGREEQAVAVSKQLGALEYIQKPFHYADFTKAVAQILRHAQPAGKAAPPRRKPASSGR